MALFGNQSISRKLTWMNLAVSAAALIMAGMAFVTYDQVSFRDRLVRSLSAQAEIIGLNSISAITFEDPDAAALTLAALKPSPTIVSAAIVTPDGRTFASFERSSQFRISSAPPIPAGQGEAHWFYADRLLSAHTINFQDKVIGTVYVTASLQILRDRLIQYIRIAIGVLILCLIASLLVSAAFRKALATPIAELAETAQTVSRDRNYAVRATPATSHDELAVLVESFNEMLSQIQTRDSALETERARLKALIDNAPVGILFAEAPSGRVVLGNRQVEEILRYPTLASPDIAGYREWLAFHPDGRRMQPEEFPLHRAITKGEIVRGEERLFTRGDDTLVWLRMSAAPVRNKEGKIVAGVVAFYDIDEEKKAEQKLRQAYERLAISQSTAKVSDWEWDLVQNRVILSPQAERQHGLGFGDFDGRFESWVNCVIPEDREKFMGALSAGVASQNTIETDYRVAAGDGSLRWLLSKASIRNDEQGKPVSVLGVSMDISTLKQAQEALLQSEKLAAAGRLAASISHEINNPLESVTNLLFLVGTDPNLSESTRRFVEQAEQELARVGHIATQTLRFYRQSTKPTSADISALLDSVVTLFRGRLANTGVEVIREYRTHEPLLCFEGELRQVFTNLVGNSLDAMGAKPGRLVMRTTAHRHFGQNEEGILVTIADNGSGIPPATLARIFEAFYSTKGSRGTGLGLWVSKEIVDKHGATMRVRSREGVGTVFSIFFPFRQPSETRLQSDSAIA